MAELSDNVRDFWQQVSESEELQSKFEAAKDHTQIIALAKEIGLEISLEELSAASQLVTSQTDGDTEELSDEQLEAVAGGAAFAGPLAVGAYAALVSSNWLTGPGGHNW